jgi:hypothetical protein
MVPFDLRRRTDTHRRRRAIAAVAAAAGGAARSLPVRTPQGEEVDVAAPDVALRVARAAESDGLESAIRALQGASIASLPAAASGPSFWRTATTGRRPI